MAATSLTSGPVSGNLTASGSSPIFSSVANQATAVVIGLSRLASTATPALMRSTDSGATWSPVALTSPGPALIPAIGQAPATFFSAAFTDTASAQYRIDVTLSGGSAFYLAANHAVFPAPGMWGFERCSIIEPGDANGAILSVTTAQLQSLINLRNTPLTAAQIAAPLTLYRQCVGGAIVKLSVPSDALTGFDNSSPSLGTNRVVRASKTTVVSCQDLNGNTIGSASSVSGDGTGKANVYTTGATMTAVDLGATSGASTGPFGGSTCFYGFHGFTTLLEATCFGSLPVNLSAFGL